ncbi:MAG: flagellar basal-body MS-ring/collar protein FliF [Bryobacteraceae bacterium]
MDQLRKLVAALSWPQRAAILAVALLSIAAIMGAMRWRHDQDFRPLFTGMAADDAAAVVQKLKQSGVDYRLEDGGQTVAVPAEKVDELRLEMAADGLPQTGRPGFELFDKTNIGITDFAQHIDYQRAIEGELERTIRTLSQVEQARVNVTFPKDSVYVDSRKPAKASVLVSLRPGAALLPRNVIAIQNLVASAVQGLTPDHVAVVDMRGDLLSRSHKGLLDDDGMSDGMLAYKQEIEKSLAAKVESTLDPLLGPGKFRVGVAVDCDFSTTDQNQEVLDPTRSVMVSQQKSEDISGGAATGGVPGTASNLPRPPADARPSSSPRTATRRTENVTYDTSRTVTQTKIPEGAIKRISAALLVDQSLQWQGTGKQRKRVLVPPAPAELKAIHDLVAGVLGLDPKRGDQLVIETLPFEQTLSDQSAPPLPPVAPPQKPQLFPFPLPFDVRWLAAGAGALVILMIVALFALRSRKKRRKVEMQGKRALPSGAKASGSQPVAAVSGSEEVAGESGSGLAPSTPIELPPFRLQLPPLGKKIESMRAGMKEIVQRDPAMAANVLRGWIEEDN